MNVKKVKALIAKELLVQSKDSATLSTMIVIPLLFGIMVPLLLICLGTDNPLVQSLGGMQFILNAASSKTAVSDVNPGSEVLYLSLIHGTYVLFHSGIHAFAYIDFECDRCCEFRWRT